MSQSEVKLMFFRATPALVLAMVGAFWFQHEGMRDKERVAAIEAMNAIAVTVKANSERISDHDIRLAVIADRLEREAEKENKE